MKWKDIFNLERVNDRRMLGIYMLWLCANISILLIGSPSGEMSGYYQEKIDTKGYIYPFVYFIPNSEQPPFYNKSYFLLFQQTTGSNWSMFQFPKTSEGLFTSLGYYKAYDYTEFIIYTIGPMIALLVLALFKKPK